MATGHILKVSGCHGWSLAMRCKKQAEMMEWVPLIHKDRDQPCAAFAIWHGRAPMAHKALALQDKPPLGEIWLPCTDSSFV